MVISQSKSAYCTLHTHTSPPHSHTHAPSSSHPLAHTHTLPNPLTHTLPLSPSTRTQIRTHTHTLKHTLTHSHTLPLPTPHTHSPSPTHALQPYALRSPRALYGTCKKLWSGSRARSSTSGTILPFLSFLVYIVCCVVMLCVLYCVVMICTSQILLCSFFSEV